MDRELTKQINFCWHEEEDATQVFGMHKQQPVSRTPWKTERRTVGQTNRHFSIFYSRQREAEEEEREAEAGTTFATTCRDISLLLFCVSFSLTLTLTHSGYLSRSNNFKFNSPFCGGSEPPK